jgi:hypothetical protein
VCAGGRADDPRSLTIQAIQNCRSASPVSARRLAMWRRSLVPVAVGIGTGATRPSKRRTCEARDRVSVPSETVGTKSAPRSRPASTFFTSAHLARFADLAAVRVFLHGPMIHSPAACSRRVSPHHGLTEPEPRAFVHICRSERATSSPLRPRVLRGAAVGRLALWRGPVLPFALRIA